MFFKCSQCPTCQDSLDAIAISNLANLDRLSDALDIAEIIFALANLEVELCPTDTEGINFAIVLPIQCNRFVKIAIGPFSGKFAHLAKKFHLGFMIPSGRPHTYRNNLLHDASSTLWIVLKRILRVNYPVKQLICL
jgi:hypothetical protein